MSLELQLLPIRGNNNFSHEVLKVDDFVLFEFINLLNQMEIEDGFYSYLSRDGGCEETHYGETLETPYGARLMWCLAKDIKTVGLTGSAGAYINAMADRDRVALYWY